MSPPTTYAPTIKPNDPYWYFLIRRLGYLTPALALLGQQIPKYLDETHHRRGLLADTLTISWIEGGKKVTSNAIQMLVEEGWRRSNDLHRFISASPASTGGPSLWPPKILFLATLCYASSLAKFTDIDRRDFLDLCAGFYDNVEVGPAPSEAERKEEP